MKQRQSNYSLTQGLIDHFIDKGLGISLANFDGFKKPFLIKRHSPDVMAIDRTSGLYYIGLVKLCPSLDDQATKEAFEDFSNRTMTISGTHKTRIPFYIAVPKDCETKIKEVFRQFEIPWNENIHVLGI